MPLDTPSPVYKHSTGHTGHPRVRYINTVAISTIQLACKTSTPVSGEGWAEMPVLSHNEGHA